MPKLLVHMDAKAKVNTIAICILGHFWHEKPAGRTLCWNLKKKISMEDKAAMPKAALRWSWEEPCTYSKPFSGFCQNYVPMCIRHHHETHQVCTWVPALQVELCAETGEKRFGSNPSRNINPVMLVGWAKNDSRPDNPQSQWGFGWASCTAYVILCWAIKHFCA